MAFLLVLNVKGLLLLQLIEKNTCNRKKYTTKHFTDNFRKRLNITKQRASTLHSQT